jgi:hypothetical protein
MKRHISLAVGSLALALAAPAQAFVLTQSSVVDFSWSGAGGGSVLSGNGRIVTAVLSPAFESLRLNVTLENTSADARLTAWGFGIEPDAVSVLLLDTGDNTGMRWAETGAFPGIATIEVCAFGSSSTGDMRCGASDVGILGGQTDFFTLNIEGPFGTSVSLSPFGFRYQTSAGSFNFACDTSGSAGQLQCGSAPPSGTVGEPGVLALLAAVGFAGTVGRRLRSKARMPHA